MPQGWRTVRVFISSTFLDMQAERDHLVRFVFPRLREELLKRRIHFVDVDLRWGVTSEQDALAVCREIIDECRPRFLCILGGRYGWTPPGQERSITADEVHYAALGAERQPHRFFYFRDSAATATMGEEYPGQFREPAGSVSAGRLEQLKSSITDAGFEPFVYPAAWDAAQRRLAGLEAFGQQVYDDLLASINEEFGTEAPAPLDEFAEEAAAMEAFIEERTARYVVGSRQALLDEMNRFVAADGSPNILLLTGAPGSGKSALLAHFFHAPSQSAIRNPQSAIAHFVGASPGSTDLRRTLRRLCHELQAITGATDAIPLSVDELIPRLSALLEQAAASHRLILLLDALNQMDPADGAHTLRWLPRALPAAVRVIISSLEHDVRSPAFRRNGQKEDPLKGGLQTGPPTAPEQHPVLQALRFRRDQVREEGLGPLTAQDAEAIATAFARRYHKTLDRAQLDALLSKAESASPLYLLVALEQLRTLGTYEEITDRIRQLPGDTRSLFLWILKDRLSNDPGFLDAEGNLVGAELVCKFVSYLGVSRHGLSHAELVGTIAPGGPLHVTPTLTLPSPSEGEGSDNSPPPQGAGCGNPPPSQGGGRGRVGAPGHGAAPDPRGNVAALERLIRPYLLRRGELLDFAHTQLCEAVEADYLAADPARVAAHAALATYFASVADIPPVAATSVPLVVPAPAPAPTSGTLVATPPAAIAGPGAARYCNTRTLSEMPYHQTGGKLWDVLESTLTDIFFLEGKAVAGLVFDLALDFSGAVAALPEGHSQSRILRLLQEAIRRDVYFVARHAKGYSQGLFQCLWNSCWWYDCPEAAEHYVVPDGGWPPGEPRWGQSGPKLSTLLERWRADRERMGHHSPWVRSLHPPVTHLGTAQRAIFLGHEAKVCSVAFSPDGRRLASASSDKTVRVWDTEAGEELWVLRGHEAEVRSVAFSPDGWRLASASSDKTVRVWDTESRAELRVLRSHEGPVTSVSFSPDSRWLASASGDAVPVTGVSLSPDSRWLASVRGGTVRVWDVDSGAVLRLFLGHDSRVNSVSFSPDGRRIASGSGSSELRSSDNTVRVWDAAHGAELRVLLGHHDKVNSVSFSPDGSRLASGSDDGTVRVWDAESGTKLRLLAREGSQCSVNSVAFSPDGRRIASQSPAHTVLVWDAEGGAEQRALRGHDSPITSMALSPDGRRIASVAGSQFYGRDHTVRVWDAETGEELWALRGHSDKVCSVSFSPDSRLLASWACDSTVRLWDPETGEELRVLRGHYGPVTGVLFSPDGRRLVSWAGDNTVRLWDTACGAALWVLHGHGSRSETKHVAFSPDGGRLVGVSREGTVQVWDTDSGNELLVLSEVRAWMSNVAFSPDGRRLAIASDDDTVRVWDTESMAELLVFSGVRASMRNVAFSPDSRRFAIGPDDGTLRVWDTTSMAEFRVLQGHEKEVTSVCFSRDGRRIVSLLLGETVRVWDAESGKCLAVHQGSHDAWVTAAAPPSFGWLALAGSSGTVIENAATRETVAWFPTRLQYITAHPCGRAWVGAVGSCVAIIKLEGEPVKQESRPLADGGRQ